MSSISVGSLEITASDTGRSLHVFWRGEADERDPRKTLLPFLDSIGAQAAAGGKEILIDFVNLQFMNSSCIGLAIAFLKSLHKTNVKVSVWYNTRHDWQTLSMKCTRTIFARYDNVTIADRAGFLSSPP